MKKHTVLIIGSGGREHALGWKMAQSPNVGKLFFAPGNPGTAAIGANVEIAVDDGKALLAFAQKNAVDLAVVGPEVTLAAGVVDAFEKAGLTIFGPTKKAAQLETDKAWATAFMKRHGIPHPFSESFTSLPKALSYVKKKGFANIVIKASGLAAGKGVVLPESDEEAKNTLKGMMQDQVFGYAGSEVVIQERLEGVEVSLLAITDGKTIVPLLPAQDHKRIYDNDQGPNTGGMGVYAPVPFVTQKDLASLQKTVLQKTVDGMAREGIPYKGIVYAGLMITNDGPKVLEYNARFGDPETQPLMRLLASDLYTLLDASARGTLKPSLIRFSADHAVCVVVAAKGYPGSYEKGRGIQGLTKLPKGVVVFHAGTAKKGSQIVSAGGRVLGVTAIGKTLAEARERVYSAIGPLGVSFDGMQYRQDIGAKALGNSVRATRIEVTSTIPDTRAGVLERSLVGQGYAVKVASLTDVYTVDKPFGAPDIAAIASMLTNPVTQQSSSTTPMAPKRFDWAMEIGFLPGVTDNVATTAKEMIADGLRTGFVGDESVYTSQAIFLRGKFTKQTIQRIAELLYNPLIQRVAIKSFSEFQKGKGMGLVVPKVELHTTPTVDTVNLNVSDVELTRIGKEGIESADGTRRGPLALDLAAMKVIAAYFKKEKRKPTDVELESIAQTWSEHCKHVIFNAPIDEIAEGLFKRYIKRATDTVRKQLGKDDFCVSVFSDNSGAIAFDKEFLVTHKVETHNSPSALDPFGGAVTGIVGVNRDALGFGMGAKPIANIYGFCVGDPASKDVLYKDKDRTQKMLSPGRILAGVIAGINAGGNCSGIPTPQGFVMVEPRYSGKPLVFAGTVGLIPRTIGKKPSYEKRALPGDYIVMIGGRVGLDGIHGATFSSEALTSGSPATAVQIGDPITQKKLSDALIREARDAGLYHSITDNGAGGLSCSVAEMAKESGGCDVVLDQVPLKYPGLSPWQIWISESQERMTLAVPKNKWKQFAALMAKRGVEATVIGEFTRTGRCRVRYEGAVVMDMAMKFLHDGIPYPAFKAEKVRKPDPSDFGHARMTGNATKRLLALLATPGNASFAPISRQYDHEVQGTSILKPIQGKGAVNGDAGVIRPILSSKKGIALSHSLYPTYGDVDMYYMAAAAIDTAIRNAVVVGANPDKIALLDNFCWCSARDPRRLWELKEAARACYDYAVAYNTPYISGKDSMFNDFSGFDAKGKPVKISIPPTLLISSIGIVENIEQVVSLDAKHIGDRIYVLGETMEAFSPIDAQTNKALYKQYYEAVQKNLIASAISVQAGGLALALAKMAIGGALGVDVRIPDARVLFAEGQGRILVTVSEEKRARFERAMQGSIITELGRVTARIVRIVDAEGKPLVDTPVGEVTKAYQTPYIP